MEAVTKKKNTAILIVGLAYWYGASPYLAVKTCHHTALESTGNTRNNGLSWTSSDTLKKNYGFIYEAYMHEEGINP